MPPDLYARTPGSLMIREVNHACREPENSPLDLFKSFQIWLF